MQCSVPELQVLFLHLGEMAHLHLKASSSIDLTTAWSFFEMSSEYALFYDWLLRDAAMASIKAAYLVVAAPLRV